MVVVKPRRHRVKGPIFTGQANTSPTIMHGMGKFPFLAAFRFAFTLFRVKMSAYLHFYL